MSSASLYLHTSCDSFALFLPLTPWQQDYSPRPSSHCPCVKDPGSDLYSTRGWTVFILFVTCPHLLFLPLPPAVGDWCYGDVMQKIRIKERSPVQRETSPRLTTGIGVQKKKRKYTEPICHPSPLGTGIRGGEMKRGPAVVSAPLGCHSFGLVCSSFTSISDHFLDLANPNPKSASSLPCCAVRSCPGTGLLPHLLLYRCSHTSCAGSKSVTREGDAGARGALPAPLPHECWHIGWK